MAIHNSVVTGIAIVTIVFCGACFVCGVLLDVIGSEDGKSDYIE